MDLFRWQDATSVAWTITRRGEGEDCASPLTFDDASTAADWLRGFDADDLRRVWQRHDDDGSSHASRVGSAWITDRLARLIVDGSLQICRRRDDSAERHAAPASRLFGGFGGAGEQPALTPSQLMRRQPTEELHWIQIELVDLEDQPVANEPYQLELPDGAIRTGTTDANGMAYVGDIVVPGTCRVCFPEIDSKEWRAA